MYLLIPELMKKLQITASSNVGLVRTNNEDMILVRNKYVRDEDYETEIDLTICDRLVVAVADGMGGYEAVRWRAKKC